MCSEDGGGDDVACDQVLANMSDGGVAAVEEWLAGNEPAPFESSVYTEPLYQQGEAAKAVSEDFFLEAGEANGNGDNYELASTILTVVMFFAGVAVVLDEGRIAWGLLGGAALMLVGASGYVLSLPTA